MKYGDKVIYKGRSAEVVWVDPLPTEDITIVFEDGNILETSIEEVSADV